MFYFVVQDSINFFIISRRCDRMIEFHYSNPTEEKEVGALLQMGLRDPDHPFKWKKCIKFKCDVECVTLESKRKGICLYHLRQRIIERKRLLEWDKQNDIILKLPERNDFEKWIKTRTILDHLARKKGFVKYGASK